MSFLSRMFLPRRVKLTPAKASRRPRTKMRFRPQLEPLEGRVLLATRVWDGGSTLSNNWTNDNNWQGNTAPVAGDDLVFPASAPDKGTDNNFPDGTRFNSITLGGGYTLRGNTIKVGAGGIIDNSGTSDIIKCDISLDGTTRTITAGTGSTLFIDGVVSSGSLVKAGAGNLSLRGHNTYSGTTQVNAGSLFVTRDDGLGAVGAGTTVKAGARLVLKDEAVGALNIAEPISLEGSSTLRAMGLVNANGPVTTLGLATIAHSIESFIEPHQFVFSGPISGPGSLNLSVGSIHFSGNSANSYQGQTTLGTDTLLYLNKSSGNAVPGNLSIASGSRVTLNGNNQIADSSTTTVNSNGRLLLQGFSETISSLILNSGIVDSDVEGALLLGNGLLTINGTVTATSTDASKSAEIRGHLLIGSTTKTFTVNDGPAFNDLNVSAEISGGGGIIKNGNGILLFTGNNTYSGLTTVDAGTLRVHGNQPQSGVIVNNARLSGNGTIGALTANNGATIRPGGLSDTGILRVEGDVLLNPGSIFQVFLDGPIAGSGHDQLDVQGPGLSGPGSGLISMNNVILDPIVGPGSEVGDQFRIINNDDLDNPDDNGGFQGLLAGDDFITPSGVRLEIFYHSGLLLNDVVLTHLNAAPALKNRTVTPQAFEGQLVTVTGNPTEVDPVDDFILEVLWGDGSEKETFVFPPGTPVVNVTHRYNTAGAYQIDLRWSDPNGGFNTGSLNTVVLNSNIVVTGTGAGAAPVVRVFDSDTGTEKSSFMAFAEGFLGGVRVAAGDIDGDGLPDVIAAAGSGGGPNIRVFSGADGHELANFFAYDAAFTNGVFVAAGDINADGRADIITGAGAGGGPHIRAFSGADLTPLASFFAFDAGFVGGVSVATGDMDGDGLADIIAGAGPGAGPHVRAFSGGDSHELASFFAFDAGFGGGVSVAARDVNNDGLADIIAGAGAGGGPQVNVFSGLDLAALATFFAYDPGFTGGVQVAVTDANGDGVSDIVTGAGKGGGPEVRILNGLSDEPIDDYFAYDGAFTDGMFVGGR